MFGWSWPWATLLRPLVVAFVVAMVPAAVMRVAGGRWSEIVAALLFVVLYVGAWRWMGADPADRSLAAPHGARAARHRRAGGCVTRRA